MIIPSNCNSKKLEQDFTQQLNRELCSEEKALLQWMEQHHLSLLTD